jgi:small subunit ribosomal protein S6
MRRYETIVIIDPDVSGENRETIFDKIKELISQKEGSLISFDDWGAKKLAYNIKKKKRGYYIRVDYCGAGPLVNEMERIFRIDDRILKYMTILLDKDADVESIKEQMAQEETMSESDEESVEEEEVQKNDVDEESSDSASSDSESSDSASSDSASSNSESSGADVEVQPESE